LERGIFHPPSENERFVFPPLEKGGEGGFKKANKDRRDVELINYKISPDPSLPKRGTKYGRQFSPLFPLHYSFESLRKVENIPD
jgi:hypothetical protein